VVWYDITKQQGDGVHQELHVNEICRVIREAGFEPVERDTLYQPLRSETELPARSAAGQPPVAVG
jgi:2-iminoacetate synthase ThiH